LAFSSLQLHRLHTKNTTFAGSVSQRVPWPPAFGVVEVALLADKVGLSPLGVRQFGVALLKHFGQVGDFFGTGLSSRMR
jgi:hypothetical protein